MPLEAPHHTGAAVDAAPDAPDEATAAPHRRRPSTADLLAGLNPVQAQAVTHPGGPLLIVAGAGSGKTRVLTHRIAWLIAEQGISPFEILAITFTNKAAQEMRDRVEALVGPVARRMWVSTFHAACVRILRRDAARLGYKSSFTIYDQADAVRLTGYVIRDMGLDTKKFPARIDPRPDLQRQKRADRLRVLLGQYPHHHRAAGGGRLPGVPAPLAGGQRHGLRRPVAGDGQPAAGLPRRAGALPAALPPRPGRRVPGHQPGPKPAGPPARRRPPRGVGGG